MKTLFRLQRNPWHPGIGLSIATERADGLMFVATSIRMEELDESNPVSSNPLLTIRPEDAQALMDELWIIGLRPSEGSGSAGSLAATERHLSDMKTIAFHALQINPTKGNL